MSDFLPQCRSHLGQLRFEGRGQFQGVLQNVSCLKNQAFTLASAEKFFAG